MRCAGAPYATIAVTDRQALPAPRAVAKNDCGAKVNSVSKARRCDFNGLTVAAPSWPTVRALPIFLLLLILAAPFSALGAAVPLLQRTEEFFPLPLDGSIQLENSGGSFHIFGWYEPRVRLVAIRKAYTAARLAQIRVEKVLQPNALTVRTAIPEVSGLFADRSGTVEYVLNVPEQSHLRVQLGTGEISLQGLRGGTAEIELTNGRVVALDCFASVKAHSVNGVLEVFYEWWENLPASFDFSLRHGRIGARLPFNAQFKVEAKAANGSIGNGFNFEAHDAGAGQTLRAATSPQAPVTLHFWTGGGNISIDSWR